jgi:hypothetical protein
VVSLRCPLCLSPLPAAVVRCPVCGGDPRAPVELAAEPTQLAPRLPAIGPGGGRVGTPFRWYLAAAAVLVGAALVFGVLLALALLAAQAGLGALVWPALIGIGAVVVVGALLQVERRRRALARRHEPDEGPTDLDLVHLFAWRFAPSASGRDAFQPPLAKTAVRADEAAWRAIAATLLDLADRDILEIEPHALPTPGGSAQVLAVRLVRPLPTGDQFAAHLLRPLTRRGVGGSTTAGDLTGQVMIAARRPARALLDSARPHLVALGFYRSGGQHATHAPTGPLALPLAWLRAALFRPLAPDPERVAAAWPALEALEGRLAAWDAREPALIASLRSELLAAFIRARARARTAGR